MSSTTAAIVFIHITPGEGIAASSLSAIGRCASPGTGIGIPRGAQSAPDRTGEPVWVKLPPQGSMDTAKERKSLKSRGTLSSIEP